MIIMINFQEMGEYGMTPATATMELKDANIKSLTHVRLYVYVTYWLKVMVNSTEHLLYIVIQLDQSCNIHAAISTCIIKQTYVVHDHVHVMFHDIKSINAFLVYAALLCVAIAMAVHTISIFPSFM